MPEVQRRPGDSVDNMILIFKEISGLVKKYDANDRAMTDQIIVVLDQVRKVIVRTRNTLSPKEIGMLITELQAFPTDFKRRIEPILKMLAQPESGREAIESILKKAHDSVEMILDQGGSLEDRDIDLIATMNELIFNDAKDKKSGKIRVKILNILQIMSTTPAKERRGKEQVETEIEGKKVRVEKEISFIRELRSAVDAMSKEIANSMTATQADREWVNTWKYVRNFLINVYKPGKLEEAIEIEEAKTLLQYFRSYFLLLDRDTITQEEQLYIRCTQKALEGFDDSTGERSKRNPETQKLARELFIFLASCTDTAVTYQLTSYLVSVFRNVDTVKSWREDEHKRGTIIALLELYNKGENQQLILKFLSLHLQGVIDNECEQSFRHDLRHILEPKRKNQNEQFLDMLSHLLTVYLESISNDEDLNKDPSVQALHECLDSTMEWMSRNEIDMKDRAVKILATLKNLKGLKLSQDKELVFSSLVLALKLIKNMGKDFGRNNEKSETIKQTMKALENIAYSSDFIAPEDIRNLAAQKKKLKSYIAD